MKKSQEKGQEINANFKQNRGKDPDSKQALEKDLIHPYEEENKEEDGSIVKSSDPESQEWHAREDTNPRPQPNE